MTSKHNGTFLCIPFIKGKFALQYITRNLLQKENTEETFGMVADGKKRVEQPLFRMANLSKYPGAAKGDLTGAPVQPEGDVNVPAVHEATPVQPLTLPQGLHSTSTGQKQGSESVVILSRSGSTT